MCAVTSIVDRSVRSIESIDGRYGGCWRRSSPKPPSHKPRRRLNSSSTPGPVDCARAVWRETLSWVPFGAAPPQVTRLSPPTIPSKPPRSSSPGTTMLGQSPLTRAHCGGGGACSLARSRALVVAVTFCSVRLHRPSRTYARAHVRHQRASRASSPFSVPPPRTHARAATALACSLARSRARARAVRLRCGRSHRPSRALRAPRVTRALAYVITAHRARHRRFPSPPCTTGTRALQRRRRSLAHARLRARGVAVVMAVAVGYAARDARNARRASLIRTRASSPRVARIIAGSIPPARTRARAAAAAALARSLACSHAHAVMACGGGGGGGD